MGDGEEAAEGQHRGEQGEDDEAGGLLDRGADPLPHGQRAPEGGPGPVPDPGEEVQQGQEAHQGTTAEVSGCFFFFSPAAVKMQLLNALCRSQRRAAILAPPPPRGKAQALCAVEAKCLRANR